jgi:hypothetical protein
MIAAIRIVSVALDFLRRNDDPFPIFAPPSQQIRPNVFDFGRIAVLLVAATLARVIWHVPGAVELFVKLHVLRGMVGILSLGRERQTKKRQAKTPHEAYSAKERHDEPPSKRWILPFTDMHMPALQTLKVIFTEQDAACLWLLLLRHSCRFAPGILIGGQAAEKSREGTLMKVSRTKATSAL